MAILKSLTFTTIPTPGGNPTLERRTKVIARLEEQKLILKDPNYTRTIQTWVKKDGGIRTVVEKQQRVAPWWRQHPNGTYALFVRSGLKPIEFEKGKPAIAVPSLDKLPLVIDAVISAIRAGELDAQLALSSKLATPKNKVALYNQRTLGSDGGTTHRSPSAEKYSLFTQPIYATN